MLTSLLLVLAGQGSNVPPKATLVLPTKPVVAGKPFKASLKLVFADGLHGYQNPPSDPLNIPVAVSLKSGGFKLVSVSYPKGVAFGSPPVKVYSGAVTIDLNLKAGAKSGPIVVQVNYQQCNESSCYPPDTVTAKATVTVAK